MIVSTIQIRAVLHRKAREFRWHQEDPNLPDTEGHGDIVPVRTARGKQPVLWVRIVDSDYDETALEYVYQVERVNAPDTPRLLTPAGRPKGSELGYTDKPYLSMTDEPEAVDQATQDRLTQAAIGRHAKRRREQSLAARRDRELLDIATRIQNAREAARHNHIDIRDDLRVVHRLQTAGRSETAIRTTLERAERRAYRDAA